MFSVVFPGQGSQEVGMGKTFYEKYEYSIKDILMFFAGNHEDTFYINLFYDFSFLLSKKEYYF